ncbi:unnamed protein product [Polarella glacialis]|uniref:Uncharacterized protein n=1 Tax=Polarella glacialis TaxID=89957 RepID=A0A813DXR4_POLGL|nr:unnamed protein product [Polarella glacialis]
MQQLRQGRCAAAHVPSVLLQIYTNFLWKPDPERFQRKSEMHGVGEASKVEPGRSGELREISSSFEGLGEKMEEVEVGMSLKVDPMSRKFGICFRAETEVGPVFVTSLTPDSPVDQWNQECQVEYAVCPCDLIVSVSGSDTAQGIVEQPMNSATAEICFLRSGPRWHLFGVTAEAMDRGGNGHVQGDEVQREFWSAWPR